MHKMYIVYHFTFILAIINSLPEYSEFKYNGNTYRIIEENSRFVPSDDRRYDNAGKTCLAYFGDEWNALKVESYAEFNEIYTKVDELLKMTNYRSIWFGAAKATSSFNDPIKFQDDAYSELGTFSGDTNNPSFALNVDIFTDLPEGKSGIDLFIDSPPLNFGSSNKCIVMWLESNNALQGTAHTFPGVLSLEDCGRFFPPYVCEKSGVDDDCGCTVTANNYSPLYPVGQQSAQSINPLAPFTDETVSFKGTDTNGVTGLVYEYGIKCDKPCFISMIDIKGQQFTGSHIKLIKNEGETNAELVSVTPENTAIEVKVDNSLNELYITDYTFTEINNQNTDFRRRDSFDVKKLLQLSEIRDWTLVKDVNGNTAIKLSPHQKGSYGFYSEQNKKFYMLSKRNTMEVFDFETRIWDTSHTPASGDPYTNSFVGLNVDLYGGQLGTVINEVFYFQNDDEATKIYTYSVATDSVNRDYLTIPDGVGKCFTSNGNILYIINNNILYSIDTSSSTPSYQTVGTLPYDTNTDEMDNTYMACGYLDGALYVFGGLKSKKVLKYDGANNQWSTILSDTKFQGYCQAQVAEEQGLIFAARGRFVQRFDPKDNSLIWQIELTNLGSFGTPILFSKYDNRLYALGGFSYGDTLTFRSNILAPKDLCEDVSCSLAGQVCVAGNCQRDCVAGIQIDGWLDDCSTKFSNNEEYVNQLSTDVSGIQTDIQTINSELLANNGDITTLQTKDESIDAEISGLKNKDTQVDGEISALQTKDESIDAEILSINAAIGNDGDVLTIKGRLKVTETDIININIAVGNDNDALSINGRIKSLETEDTNINSKILNINTAIGDDNEALTIKGRVKDLETDVSGINVAIGDDNDALTIKGRVNNLEITDTSINTQIAAINTEIGDDATTSTIKGRLKIGETKDINIDSQISSINTQITNIQASVNTLNGQMAAVTAAKTPYDSQLNIIDNDKKSYFDNGTKDILIISLLVTNVLTMIGLIIQCHLSRKSSHKYRKYDQINAFSSADDENSHLKS
eukprot:456611_1